MKENALQPGNTVLAAQDKRPDFSLTDFKEGRVFEWLTGLKSGYQQAMEEQALADLAKELGFKGFARCLREYRKELRAVSLSVVRDDGISEFFDQALELNVGEWTADESGIWRYAQGGGITYACTHPIMPVEKLVSIDTGMVKVKLWYRRSYSDRRPWSEIVVPMSRISKAADIVACLTAAFRSPAESGRRHWWTSSGMPLTKTRISSRRSRRFPAWVGTRRAFPPTWGA